MYESFYRSWIVTQEDFEYAFDGHDLSSYGVVDTLDTVADQALTSSWSDFATGLQEENQTAFALRSLGIAAVLASADGPLPFGDALAVGWLIGAGVYGLLA